MNRMNKNETEWVAARLVGDFDFDEGVGLHAIEGIFNQNHIGLDEWPALLRQEHDGDFSTGQVLLVSDIFVSGNHAIEATGFGGTQQIPVFLFLPSTLGGSFNKVRLKMPAHWRGSTVVD